MYQSDRSSFRTKDSMSRAFTRTCLGKFVILFVVLLVLFLLAKLTRPGHDTMVAETRDGIMECIQDNDSIHVDEIDDFMRNMAATFTHADTTNVVTKELMQMFDKFNQIKVDEHSFYSVSRIVNNLHPEGTRAGFGIFGMVVPMVSLDDLILRNEKMRGRYLEKLINKTISGNSEYFGKDPDLGNTYNTYEGGGSGE